MKKYFILTMLLSFSLLFSQPVPTHEIFHLWAMDKWDKFNNGEDYDLGKKHDMDFICRSYGDIVQGGYGDYKWKFIIGNSSGVSYSDSNNLSDETSISPTWGFPNAQSTGGGSIFAMDDSFEPEYFIIYFYDGNGVKDKNLTIGADYDDNQIINLNNEYMYDMWDYYESEIKSFSGSVDLQSGDIHLSTEIIQPDKFWLRVVVNGLTYSTEYYSFPYNFWTIEKTIDDIVIDYDWLVENELIGSLNIKLILDSKLWKNKVYYTVYDSDNRTIYRNNTPIVPTISMSGSWGENPILIFSGDGPVDHYVLKKEYDFNDGTGFHASFVDPVSGPSWTDVNVVRERFGGDLVARYSVQSVSPLDVESDFSNTVSTTGQSNWKRAADSEKDEASIKYSLGENYPNPFNPTTKISYQIPKNSFVNLVVYNALGQEVARLVNQRQSSGQYSVQFNATNLPSGVYVYKLQAGEFTSVKKMMLTK